jgi:hypothetical protein
MAKYFSFYVTTISLIDDSYSVYYDEVNESKYATNAYNGTPLKNFIAGTPGELPYFVMNVEVPDSATSVIVKSIYETQIFPLVSTPPTVGTLFLTFDIID